MYLINNLDRQQKDDREKEEQDTRQKELLDFTNMFISQMMLAQTRTSNFRGQRIDTLYSLIRMKKLDMFSGEIHEISKPLATRFQSYLN
ncbi:hypothetical protein F4782DRAFT_475925 [Xylaria castorea]|nr:hypothetical protein F4782DRAFT_475925 [Xylaria castorea]